MTFLLLAPVFLHLVQRAALVIVVVLRAVRLRVVPLVVEDDLLVVRGVQAGVSRAPDDIDPDLLSELLHSLQAGHPRALLLFVKRAITLRTTFHCESIV